MRSARPRPQGVALVSRALVCVASLAFAGAPQSARRLPAAKAAGGLSIGELAHLPALDRRAARADHTLRAPPTGKIPDRLCLPTPARGARLRPLLWGRRMAGSERLGPKRFKRPRARRIAQSGWPRRPPASAGRFFFLLSSHLAFFLAIALFVFSAFFLAQCAQAAKQNRVGRSLRPFFFFGFFSFRRSEPGNKKAERSAGNAPLLANSIGSALRGHSARGLGVTANRACRCAIAFSRSFGPLPTAEFAGAGCFASPRWPWPRRS